MTLVTDPVAFVHSNSSVITHTNFTDINETALYYKLCLFVPTWDVFDGRYELRNCTYNGTELDLEVQWDRAGALNLSVFVFSEDQKDFLGCAKTGITVAGQCVCVQPLASACALQPVVTLHVDLTA